MFDSYADLINANNRAITALNQCLARYNQLLIGALPSENSFLQAQINQATSERNLLNISNTHLAAATVEFEPFDLQTKQDLERAFRRIDDAIVSNETINAGIDTVNDIFEAAGRIREITGAAG